MNLVKVLSYGKYFTTSKFMYFISNPGKSFGYLRKAVTLFYCLKDKDTPNHIKAIIVGGLGYLILPADVVPDVLAGLGWLDDVAVITLVLNAAEKYIKPEHEVLAKAKVPFGKDDVIVSK